MQIQPVLLARLPIGGVWVTLASAQRGTRIQLGVTYQDCAAGNIECHSTYDCVCIALSCHHKAAAASSL